MFLRASDDLRRELQAATIALLASIAIGSVLMLVLGASPGRVWWAMLEGTAGSRYFIGELIYRATAIALCGLAVAIALDAGLFNIGGEAQLTAGVVLTATVGTALPAGTPAVIAIPICMLAAAVGGAAIGFAIGGLRAWRGTHEVITSIILNAIVGALSLWLGNEYLFVKGTLSGAEIVDGARMPRLGLGGSAANASVVIAIVAIAGVWWLRSRTTWGSAWRAVGRDPDAARTVGISVGRVQVVVMAVAGGLAGLSACDFVMGNEYAFEQGLGAGTGFLGVSAALLGRNHPAGVALASLLLAFLSTGGLVVGDLVPKELTEMLQGIVVIAVAGASAWVARRGAR